MKPEINNPLHPIFCDFIVKEDDCNLACTYCLTGQSNFKDRHSEKLIFEKPSTTDFTKGTIRYIDLKTKVLNLAAAGITTIKFSGGEFLMHRGAVDFLAEISPSFETVVLLSNGFYIKGRNQEVLNGIGNLVLQISFDGVDFESSHHRHHSRRIHDRFLTNLSRLLEAQMIDEIYCVLHAASLEGIETTIDFLQGFDRVPKFLPFPMRGPHHIITGVQSEQLPILRTFKQRCERSEPGLPNSSYAQALLNFYQIGERRIQCHLPRVAFTYFDDGFATSCPNIWFERYKSDHGINKLFQELEQRPFRDLLLASKPRIKACQGCFTPWDPISAYIRGDITLSALEDIPAYAGKETTRLLALAKVSFEDQYRGD